MKEDSHSDSELKKIFQLKNIAVVGMSKNEEKAGHFVPKYLMRHGYNIIPVNPTITEALGKSHIQLLQILLTRWMLLIYSENQKMCYL